MRNTGHRGQKKGRENKREKLKRLDKLSLWSMLMLQEKGGRGVSKECRTTGREGGEQERGGRQRCVVLCGVEKGSIPWSVLGRG